MFIRFQVNITDSYSWQYISLLAETSAKNSIQIQVYKGIFNANNPCTNLVAIYKSTNDVPHIHSAVLFSSASYTIVGMFIFIFFSYCKVQTTIALPSALFAIHIDKANFTAKALSDGNYWIPPLNSQECQTNFDTNQNYVYYSWTQNTTGYFDVFVYSNSAINASIAFYNTTPSFLNAPSDANSAPNPCNDGFMFANPSFWRGYPSEYSFLYIKLTTGTNYTIIASGNATSWFGFRIQSTSIRTYKSESSFNRPNLDEASCSHIEDNFVWDAWPLEVTSGVYIIDNAMDGYYGFLFPDTVACLYQGQNLGNDTDAPDPCPYEWIKCQDTGNIGPLIISGAPNAIQLSIVQSIWSSGSDFVGKSYSTLVYTGIQIPQSIVNPMALITSGGITTDQMTSGNSVTSMQLTSTETPLTTVPSATESLANLSSDPNSVTPIAIAAGVSALAVIGIAFGGKTCLLQSKTSDYLREKI